MRYGPRERRAAAAVYGLFGAGALASAILTSSLVLVVVALVSIVAAVLAFDRFPVDRNW